MGRIKSTLVKKTAKILIQKQDHYTDNFEHNKKILGRNMPSKPIRNKIAGYITRLIRMQKFPRVKKVAPAPAGREPSQF